MYWAAQQYSRKYELFYLPPYLQLHMILKQMILKWVPRYQAAPNLNLAMLSPVEKGTKDSKRHLANTVLFLVYGEP